MLKNIFSNKLTLICLTWLTGNLICLIFSIQLWPFSSFDMFTNFKTKNEVYVIKTQVITDDQAVMYEQIENNLPVIRFWQKYLPNLPDTEATNQYLKTWLQFHHFLEGNPKFENAFIKVVQIKPAHQTETILVQRNVKGLSNDK